MEQPETRYARSGDVHIAYQVLGDGPFDVVWVPAFVSNVELAWQVSSQAEFIRRLASKCRLIRFDKRGTGMSDRVAALPSLETRMDDVRAVMDAAGSERAALLGASEGGPMSILFAATYPERVWALALWSTFARIAWSPRYPIGLSRADWLRGIEDNVRGWGDTAYMEKRARGYLPGADDETVRHFASTLRQSASPGAVDALLRMNLEIDVIPALPAIGVPTLVFFREGDNRLYVQGSRYLAEHIPGARLVEFPGHAHPMEGGVQEDVVAALDSFLRESWELAATPTEPDRVLATVLFTDIVDSTAKMAELGDRRWRELIESHHAQVRRQLAQFRGTEIDTAGDGFFARFDGPARAIRCAQAISGSVAELGLEVRAGLHTGECEVADGKVAGIAVVTGARVAAQAGPGEVLVSGTVKDLVAGSGIAFADRGTRELKGVPGEWHLYAVGS